MKNSCLLRSKLGLYLLVRQMLEKIHVMNGLETKTNMLLELHQVIQEQPFDFETG